VSRLSVCERGSRRAASVAIVAVLFAAGVASAHAHDAFDDPAALRVAQDDARVRTTACVACVIAHVGVDAEEFVVVGRPERATYGFEPASSPTPPAATRTRRSPRGPPASV